MASTAQVHASLPFPDMTINAILDYYLRDRSNPHSENPCFNPDGLDYTLRAVREAWGSEQLKDFHENARLWVKEKVLEWKSDEKDPKAAGTCRKRMTIMQAAFNMVVRDGIINIAHKPIFELPKGGVARERFLDNSTELVRLLQTIDAIRPDERIWHVGKCAELLIRTGERMSAALELEWSHVNFEKREIRFRDTQTIERRSKKRRGNKYMDDDLLAFMRDLYQYRSDETDRVIHFFDKPIKSVRNGMVALFERAGIVHLRTHDLRKAAAQYAVLGTGSVDAAATLLSDTAGMVRKHYANSHLAAESEAGISAVSEILREARAKKAA